MHEATQFLLDHGYVVLFSWTLIDQLGVPIVVVPVLLAAGALGADGDLNWVALLASAGAASFLATQFWFELGRYRGFGILHSICHISLEPSICVRQSQEAFARYGLLTLLAARFMPGLNAMAPPLAGISGMARTTFVAVNAGASVLWAGLYIALGWLLRDQLEEVLAWLLRLGNGALILVAILAGYVAYKHLRRRRALRQLHMDRIAPEELHDQLQHGEDIAVLDVRHPLEIRLDPRALPGAVQLAIRDLDEHPERVPRATQVAIYCNCPNEATSARSALLLKRHSVARVRPLAGGFAAWESRGLPLVPVVPPLAGGAASEGEPEPC